MSAHGRKNEAVPAYDYGFAAHWGGRHVVDRRAWRGVLSLRRVRLNAGGYSPGKYGQYFGSGPPLWFVQDEEGDPGPIDFHIRAADRVAARRLVLSAYPNARVR